MIDNELKLKKLIQRIQKIEFIDSVLPQDKLGFKKIFYLNIFLLFNLGIFGIWRFSYK